MGKTVQKIITTLLLLTSFMGLAQVYPVQMTPVFNVPYSSRLSDYATSMEVKMQLLINTTDIGITNRQVRLKMYVQGNGIQAQSTDVVVGMNPLYINGGELLTLTNLDLAALFRLENLEGISPAQYATNLPEGLYSICFELYDYLTQQRISQKSCAQLYLMLNEPPLLNTPARNESIAVTEFPNILFTWTPRQINATNVSYQFELKEILDPTIDPQIGFLTSPILYEEELRSTALLYDISKPNLLPGKRYAWRVRAISTSGVSLNNVFKNDGYSEIYTFTYASHCPAPSFLLSEAVSARSVRISWLGDKSHTKYHVQYRKANVVGAEWFEVYTMNSQTTLSDLEAGVSYEFRVGGSCEPAVLGNTASFTYSGINQFSMPAAGTSNSTFTCGLNPTVAIANQTPITNLIVGETFTAGDFSVKILELTGNNPYSGKGYIIVPYLADTKIAVVFNAITINTNYQLIKGVVETTYNPEAPNIVDVDPLIVEVFGSESTSTEIINSDTNNSSGTNSQITVGQQQENSTGNEQSDNSSENINNSSSDSNGNNPVVENSSTGVNTNESPKTVNSNNNEDKNYSILYNNKKYSNGEVIKIPYNRSSITDEKFKLIDFPKEVDVNYEISYKSQNGNVKDKYEGAFGDYKKKIQSKDQISVDFSLDNALKYKMKSTAQTDANPFVLNDIILIPKTFKLDKIKVIDLENTDRFAVNGQTLYFVKNIGVTNRRARFISEISPNLNSEEIPYESIEWWLNHQLWRDGFGKNDFTQKIFNDKNVTVKCKAGYPVLYGSEVKVRWVNGATTSDKFAFNFDKIDKVKDYIDKLKRYINVPIYTSLTSYNNSNDPLSFLFSVDYLNERKNKESEKNRLYYTEIKNEVTLNIGVKGKIEKPVPGLATPELKRKLWGKDIELALGIYWFIEANAGGKLGVTREAVRWVESSNDTKIIWKYLDPSAIELDTAIGLNPKAVFKIPNFEVEISGKSTAKVELLKVDFKNSQISCPLIDNGIVLSCVPVADISLGALSWSHTFDKYEYNFKPW
ncbi:fibronectin type III domain-containing protein [Flavobacterium columnare]|uniref:fibronectin type III domain-containing protein n=1 Tax=Flavobacterium columnare TaxID=996 RepID=UPI003B9DCF28